jgi:hypothetical protein
MITALKQGGKMAEVNNEKKQVKINMDMKCKLKKAPLKCIQTITSETSSYFNNAEAWCVGCAYFKGEE